MSETIKCLKCNGVMIEGYIPDFGHGFMRLLNWVQGAPITKKSLFGLTTVNVKAKEREAFPLMAFRCQECGLVDLYAREMVKK